MTSVKPSPKSIGRFFASRYYTLVHDDPTEAETLYDASAVVSHATEGDKFAHGSGKEEVHRVVEALNADGFKAVVSDMHCQEGVPGTLIVTVLGFCLRKSAPTYRRFTQTFVLEQINGPYYIKNDVFRLLNAELTAEEILKASKSSNAAKAPQSTSASASDAAESTTTAVTEEAAPKQDAAPVAAESPVVEDSSSAPAPEKVVEPVVDKAPREAAPVEKKKGEGRPTVKQTRAAEAAAAAASSSSTETAAQQPRGPRSWADIASRGGNGGNNVRPPQAGIAVRAVNGAAAAANRAEKAAAASATGVAQATPGGEKTSDESNEARERCVSAKIDPLSVCVKQLPEATDDQLKEVFSQFGNIVGLINKSSATSHVAFIEFDSADAVAAILKASEITVLGKAVRAEEKRERRPDRPMNRRPQSAAAGATAGGASSSSPRGGSAGGQRGRGGQNRGNRPPSARIAGGKTDGGDAGEGASGEKPARGEGQGRRGGRGGGAAGGNRRQNHAGSTAAAPQTAVSTSA